MEVVVLERAGMQEVELLELELADDGVVAVQGTVDQDTVVLDRVGH